MITRFAPSPTGYMHIGNARTALVCWLYARHKSGKFLLRVDDTDLTRSEDKYVESAKDDLKWLSMDWDLCFNQRSRIDRYNEVFDLLVDRDVVYPCYETPEELEVRRKMMLKMGLPPIYSRTMQNTIIQGGSAQGNRQPYFRLEIDSTQEISWRDEVRGEIVFQAKNIGDPIIRRTDGSYTYMFPSVVDDMDFSITHIIRGEDHVSNTAAQIHIMDLLAAARPTFAHLPLLRVGDSKISKREGGTEIYALRDASVEPMAINSYLAKIGTSAPVEPCTDIQALADSFDITLFNQAPIAFMVEDMLRLNVKLLQKMSFQQAREKLELNGVSCFEELWYAVRGNIETIQDVKKWVDICGPGAATVINDADKWLIDLARGLLPKEELTGDTWKVWLQRIKEQAGCSTRDILPPLRMALTGVSHGPEFAKLLPLIGRTEILRRLAGTQ
ncbi:MAG: glutamate--tRNA ligase [Anaplasma sp.]